MSFVFLKAQKQLSVVTYGWRWAELHQAKNLTRELGISEKVFFLGKSKRIEQITSISDVFLLPSEKESFGLEF